MGELYLIDDDLMIEIGDAIRTMRKTTDPIPSTAMAQEILAIESGPSITEVKNYSIPTASGNFTWTPSSMENYLKIEIETNGYATYNHTIFYPIKAIWPNTSTPNLSHSTSYCTNIPLFMYASSSYDIKCVTYNNKIYCYTGVGLASWVTRVSEVSIG